MSGISSNWFFVVPFAIAGAITGAAQGPSGSSVVPVGWPFRTDLLCGTVLQDCKTLTCFAAPSDQQ